MKNIIGFLIICLILSGCNSNKNLVVENESSHENIFEVKEIHTTDDEEATNDFSRFLKGNSIDVKRYGGNTLLVTLDDSKFLLEPIINKGFSRIKITSVFSLDKEYVGSVEVIQALLEVNKRANFGQYSLNEDGDAIHVVTNTTFLDKVELKEILETMRYSDQVTYYAVDTLEHLKKVLK